tara:strand:+ start:626 stop:736 length:111 start_codon:yes stop_codon:yes gene_type:complete
MEKRKRDKAKAIEQSMEISFLRTIIKRNTEDKDDSE